MVMVRIKQNVITKMHGRITDMTYVLMQLIQRTLFTPFISGIISLKRNKGIRIRNQGALLFHLEVYGSFQRLFSQNGEP